MIDVKDKLHVVFNAQLNHFLRQIDQIIRTIARQHKDVAAVETFYPS